jgi:hypothetical protein
MHDVIGVDGEETVEAPGDQRRTQIVLDRPVMGRRERGEGHALSLLNGFVDMTIIDGSVHERPRFATSPFGVARNSTPSL